MRLPPPIFRGWGIIPSNIREQYIVKDEYSVLLAHQTLCIFILVGRNYLQNSKTFLNNEDLMTSCIAIFRKK